MPNRRTPPTGRLTLAVLCAAFATACASTVGGASSPDSGNSSGNSSASSPVVSPSPSPSMSAPATPTTSTSAGPSATAGTTTCAAAQLAVKADGSGAATGHSELLLQITNTGAGTCTLSGFPAVTGRLQSGETVHGVDTDSVFIGMVNPGSRPGPVSLASGAHAWVPLNFSDNPVNGAASCATFASFSVTLPGVEGTFTVKASNSGTGSAPDCAGIEVPPVLAATDAVVPSSS